MYLLHSKLYIFFTICGILLSFLLLTHFRQRLNALVYQRAAYKAPNIVFFLADDYGWNDIGYHDSEIKTPNMDKLAAEGVKLENYFVQPICTPSRCQLLSGRYDIHTGMQHGIVRPAQLHGLPLNIPTIADKLSELGYATHAIGKWHLGFFKKEYLPTNRGFDSFFGYLLGSVDYYTRRRCYQGMCGYDFHLNERPFNTTKEYSSSYFATRAERVIEDHATKDGERPLFLYLPFQSVHVPYTVPRLYQTQYRHIVNKARRTYAGMVSCMDEAVGNITRFLKEQGLWDNTVFIFSTDNGAPMKDAGNNWPLAGGKGSYWDGGVRGVAFVTGGLVERRSAVSSELMHISDWFPTLLKLAGGRVEGLQLDGYDIWESISKGTPSPRTELLHTIDPLTSFYGTSLPGSPFDTRVRAAIRQGRWKLMTGNPGGCLEGTSREHRGSFRG